MTRSHRVLILGLLVSLGAASACKKNNPLPPSPVLTTQNFTGNVSPLGTSSHEFTVNYTGGYSDAAVTVTNLTTVASATPQSITIGVGFGEIINGVCSRLTTLSSPVTRLNERQSTPPGVFAPGTYCVQVFDNPSSPTVTEPLAYSITVEHV
jgi:hypothetical protein